MVHRKLAQIVRRLLSLTERHVALTQETDQSGPQFQNHGYKNTGVAWRSSIIPNDNEVIRRFDDAGNISDKEILTESMWHSLRNIYYLATLMRITYTWGDGVKLHSSSEYQ